MIRLISCLCLASTFAFAPLCSGAAAATQPAVEFDVTALVGFADSTTPEFAAAHPGEKSVRAEIVVSLFVPPAVEVTHALYHLYFLEGPAQIIDYAPRTRVATDIVGEIDVSQNAEQGKHVSLSAAARFDSWINADASTGRNQSTGTSSRYKRQPPVATVVAAGTTNRGQGVYFKLQQSPTETLEGEQRLELQLRVPGDWRGGYLRMVAQASNDQAAFPASSFLVPVYLQGDGEAQRVAQQLLTFQRHFLSTAAHEAESIRRAGRPTMAHEIALKSPEIPEEWQAQLLWRPTSASPPAFTGRLPKRVRVAAANYHTAKRLAIALGQRPPHAARYEVAKPAVEVDPPQVHQTPAKETVGGWVPRGTQFPPRGTPRSSLRDDPSSNR